MLAATTTFASPTTSQGMPFMFCGAEIWRDKKGVHNSYKSPDDINAIDWNMKLENREQFDYYRNLIALRKAHPAFRMTNPDDIAKNIVFDKVKQPCVVSYSIINNANGDSWNTIRLIFNGNDKPVIVNVKKGDYTGSADDGKINPQGLGSSKGGKITVAPRSATILAF